MSQFELLVSGLQDGTFVQPRDNWRIGSILTSELYQATVKGDAKRVKQCLELSKKTGIQVGTKAATYSASKAGNVEILRLLLDYGVIRGLRTELQIAAAGGHLEYVQLLISTKLVPWKCYPSIIGSLADRQPEVTMVLALASGCDSKSLSSTSVISLHEAGKFSDLEFGRVSSRYLTLIHNYEIVKDEVCTDVLGVIRSLL